MIKSTKLVARLLMVCFIALALAGCAVCGSLECKTKRLNLLTARGNSCKPSAPRGEYVACMCRGNTGSRVTAPYDCQDLAADLWSEFQK